MPEAAEVAAEVPVPAGPEAAAVLLALLANLESPSTRRSKLRQSVRRLSSAKLDRVRPRVRS